MYIKFVKFLFSFFFFSGNMSSGITVRMFVEGDEIAVTKLFERGMHDTIVASLRTRESIISKLLIITPVGT